MLIGVGRAETVVNHLDDTARAWEHLVGDGPLGVRDDVGPAPHRSMPVEQGDRLVDALGLTQDPLTDEPHRLPVEINPGREVLVHHKRQREVEVC